VIHKPYLRSKTSSENEIPAPTFDDSNNSFVSQEQSHTNTPATSGSSLDDNGSSIFDEQSYSNNHPASESSLDNSLSSTSSPPEQSTRARNSKTDRKHELACDTCGHTFNLRYKLNQHVNRKCKKRFKCSVNGCSSVFGLKTDLYRHKKTHQASAAQERFNCPETNCGRHFTRNDNPKRHQRECH
jgi:hypothetical protein